MRARSVTFSMLAWNDKRWWTYTNVVFCHHADTICHPNSSYVTTKLYETWSTCGCNNNTIFQNELFLRFLPSTYVAWQRRSLGDPAKVARWRNRWIHHFLCLKFRFCVTTLSNNYYDYIVKWCSGIACDWSASLDIAWVLALSPMDYYTRYINYSRKCLMMRLDIAMAKSLEICRMINKNNSLAYSTTDKITKFVLTTIIIYMQM